MNVKLKNSNLINIFNYFLVYLVWTLISLFLFSKLHKAYFNHLRLTLESQFKSDTIISNMNFIYRTFMQYEAQGLIKCAKLTTTNQIIFDLTYKDKCKSNNSIFNEDYVTDKIQAISGQEYTLNYQLVNPKEITYLFIVVLLIGAVMIYTLYIYQNLKIKNIERLKELELKKNNELFQLSYQLSHDIRSPLSALNLIGNKINFENEEIKEIFKSSIERINFIASNILEESKSKYTSDNLISVSDCLNIIYLENKSLLLEKNISYDCISRADETKIKINKFEFLRVISNIFNNSVDALENISNAKITSQIVEDAEKIQIIIEDNGKGMTPNQLEKIGQLGYTTKKLNGNGIGLHHAFNYLKSQKIDLDFTSISNKGTKAFITIYKINH